MDNRIEKAKKAFEIYALDDNPDKTANIYKTLKERIDENEGPIRRVLELTEEELEYEDIVQLLSQMPNNISGYKKTLFSQKINENFTYSTYQVPVGIVAVEADNTKDAIESIFSAVTTRNSLILMQDKDNPYRIEKLLEIIIGECIEKYGINRNLIQILENEKIDSNLVDVYISKDKQVTKKQLNDIYYIYREDEFFDKYIIEEQNKLTKLGKRVQVIDGDPNQVIEVINNNNAFASAIYTQNRKLGYKFINLVNSDNVYMNVTLENAKRNESLNNVYYKKKNIAFEVN